MLLVLFSHMFGTEMTGWFLVAWILVGLLAIRIGFAVSRKVFPFSREIRAIWFERRQLAKRFDSYQWQKVFWLGLGFASYMVLSGELGTMGWVLTVSSLISGAGGVVIWWRRVATMEVP